MFGCERFPFLSNSAPPRFASSHDDSAVDLTYRNAKHTLFTDLCNRCTVVCWHLLVSITSKCDLGRRSGSFMVYMLPTSAGSQLQSTLTTSIRDCAFVGICSST